MEDGAVAKFILGKLGSAETLDVEDPANFTLLTRALFNHNFDLADVLLDRGASLNY